MNRYQCSVCGYIYNPAEGNPGQGIPAGTPFEQVPGTWSCPVCGAKKVQFQEMRQS